MLLALTAGLFDALPIERIDAAVGAVVAAAATIPAEVTGRFDTARSLSDADRTIILDLARHALAALKP